MTTTVQENLSGADPLLAVRDLDVQYRIAEGDVDLVKGVNFEVGVGEIVCLVGESGSGKSLTASALLGLLRRNKRMTVRGRLEFEGADLNTLSNGSLRKVQGREIGMIFQNPAGALDPVIPIGKQIAEAVARRRTGRADIRRRVIELVDWVGISDPEHRVKQFPHEISGGMCQRAAIAIALAGDPKLLIADEPTTALDVTIQAQILALLKQIRDDRRMSVLLITHDMGVAAQTADRIIVMYAGSIVEAGPTKEFFAHAGHPYSIGLINAVPRVDGARARRFSAIPGSMPEARNRPAGCAFHPRCSIASDRCREETPELRQTGTQLIACHRADEVLSGLVKPWSTEAAVPRAGGGT
jgi:oligopeptide/dipeptide ABC transporter ATP-binding protein